MGASRASSNRKRLRGETCYRCGRMLPPPPPGFERACTACQPRRHRLTAHIQQKDWCVTFTREEPGSRSLCVGPWLLFSGEDALVQMLQRGHASAEHMQQYARTMKAWGTATVDIFLSDEQYIRLLEAGIRDPRNGHDKLKDRKKG